MRHRALAYFSLGSNLGDRMGNLEVARSLMEEKMGRVEQVSKVYESSPWGFSSENPFYNCCLILSSGLKPADLMGKALQVEQELGRVREKSGYSDRLIDIDLLLYEDLVLNQPDLILPHPRMEMRKFVLLPLVELAPSLIHPVSGHTMAELLEQCRDPSGINPV